MTVLTPVTAAVHEDEKAWSLRETNMIRPPSYRLRRYQVITVIRDDVKTQWWNDMGPAEDFTTPQLEVPSLLEHSVAELRDIALSQHDGSAYWLKFMAEKQAESTLMTDAVAYFEENRKRIHNLSVFGPGGHKQRNGFDRKAALSGSY